MLVKWKPLKGVDRGGTLFDLHFGRLTLAAKFELKLKSLAIVFERDCECLNKGNISEDHKEKTNTRDVKSVDNTAYGSCLVEKRKGEVRF